jgi:hypothetical protein
MRSERFFNYLSFIISMDTEMKLFITRQQYNDYYFDLT